MDDNRWKKHRDSYVKKIDDEKRFFSVRGRSRLHYTQLFAVSLTEKQATALMMNILDSKETEDEFRRTWVEDCRVPRKKLQDGEKNAKDRLARKSNGEIVQQVFLEKSK